MRMTAICSSSRRPRLWKFSFSASYSTAFQPMPRPSRSRPPLSTSTSAACLAIRAVCRCGAISTLVTSSTGMAGRVGAEHVVVNRHVVEAELLGCLHVVSHHRRIGGDLQLREDNAELHPSSSLCPCGRRSAWQYARAHAIHSNRLPIKRHLSPCATAVVLPMQARFAPEKHDGDRTAPLRHLHGAFPPAGG